MLARNIQMQSALQPPGRCRRGFTLTQLTVCVAAMMLGLVFFVPAMKHRIGSASSTRCMENLRKIYDALYMYERDNDGWWPERQVWTQAGLIKDSNVWISLLAERRYIDDINRFTCPADPNAPRGDSLPMEFLRRQIAYAPSYGLNQLTWREYAVAPSDDSGIRRKPSEPARTILLADLGPDFAERDLPKEESARRRVLEAARDAGRLVADDGFRIGLVAPPPPWLTPRHGRVINLMAMGGNVSKSHDATKLMSGVPESYYDDCATGNCTFCNVFRAPHYDFSSSKLYWWTGPYDRPGVGRPDTVSRHNRDP